jgi:hypothetical protein
MDELVKETSQGRAGKMKITHTPGEISETAKKRDNLTKGMIESSKFANR